MINTLFPQSSMPDPYSFYAAMLEKHPLYFDQPNNLRAVYSYDDCCKILNNSGAYVPEKTSACRAENEEVKKIIGNLARLSNPPHHSVKRQAASAIFKCIQPVDVPEILRSLIRNDVEKLEWVNDVGKKLPVLSLLKGFSFPEKETALILAEIETLTTLMVPSRSDDQNRALNESVKRTLVPVSAYVTNMFGLKSEADVLVYAANLIGLLVQSFDAGRGLLSNSLLQVVKNHPSSTDSLDYFERSVRETLRFDPPVHNTRRILKTQIVLRDKTLQAGENILVVLAAANRDPAHFNAPDVFNIDRTETPQYLTYGTGAHQCLAEHFSIHITASALHYIFSNYDQIALSGESIEYEPKVNARLPMKINLCLS